jgi:hypothetical protein
MKFKDLTEAQIEYAKVFIKIKKSWDDRMNLLVKFFGKSERTARKWCAVKLGFKEKIDVEPEQYIKAKTKSHDTKTKRFIITWAQNNTPVHKGFS